MEIEDFLLYVVVLLAFLWATHFPPKWLFLK